MEKQPIHRQESETRMAVGVAVNHLVTAKENGGDADAAMQQLLEKLVQPGAIDVLLSRENNAPKEVLLQPGVESNVSSIKNK
jgi:hypothetical protein